MNLGGADNSADLGASSNYIREVRMRRVTKGFERMEIILE